MAITGGEWKPSPPLASRWWVVNTNSCCLQTRGGRAARAVSCCKQDPAVPRGNYLPQKPCLSAKRFFFFSLFSTFWGLFLANSKKSFWMLLAKMLPKVVCGGWCVFSLSKKSSCSPLPEFRSWNCLFFLFEVETLETSPFRDQKKEKERKKKESSRLPLAWRLFACLFLTFLPICSLHRNPGQPGLGSGSRTTNSQTIQKKNSLALKLLKFV